MTLNWGVFERIVRLSPLAERGLSAEHPFEVRNFSSVFPAGVQKLFDDGHYSQASFEAFKYIEQILRDKAEKPAGYGSGLIKYALEGDDPPVKLDCPPTEKYATFRDNFLKMLIGAFGNIRNPHGHKLIDQGLDECLDELTMAAYFIRILDPAAH